MVRAANTGISAIIDPFGRIVASAPLGVEAVIDGDLPGSLPPTLFSRHSRSIPMILWILALIGAYIRPRSI
jgi:apolipoprotein N-acyltransferase